MKQFFLIQVELDEKTRLYCETRLLTSALEQMAGVIYRTWGDGPVPQIRAVHMPENSSVSITAGALETVDGRIIKALEAQP